MNGLTPLIQQMIYLTAILKLIAVFAPIVRDIYTNCISRTADDGSLSILCAALECNQFWCILIVCCFRCCLPAFHILYSCRREVAVGD